MSYFKKSKQNTPSMKKGDEFTSNNHGNFEIIGYSSAKDIKVRFLDTGEIGYTSCISIRKGQVNPYETK